MLKCGWIYAVWVPGLVNMKGVRGVFQAVERGSPTGTKPEGPKLLGNRKS